VPLGDESLNAEMMLFKIGPVANPACVVSDSGIVFSQNRSSAKLEQARPEGELKASLYFQFPIFRLENAAPLPA
jgi:hypothetical protein